MLKIFDKNKIKYNKLSQALKDKWSFDDFLKYRMQEKSISEIEEFMTEEELWNLESQFNDNGFREIFNDKKLFYEKFKDARIENGITIKDERTIKDEMMSKKEGAQYINRDILFLEDASFSDFRDFYEKQKAKGKQVLLKPSNMYAGIGIRKADASDLERFEELKAERYIAEEFLEPAMEYAKIYPHSLNVIRVTTLVKPGRKLGVDADSKVDYVKRLNEGINESEGCIVNDIVSDNVEILFACNGFGKNGKIVDNDDEDSIWAVIDIETGKIIYSEIDSESGLVQDFHPDSGKQIVGFENPCWDRVVRVAKELALVIPQCRLVGWDIAIRDDYNIELIEGNVTPELNLYQVISGKGLRNKILNNC